MNRDLRLAGSRAGLLVFLLLTPLVASACSHASTSPGTASRATAMATMAATMAPAHATMAVTPSTEGAQVRDAAWAARPAYTHTSTRTEEAYRYALDHPDTLQWLPCYCGCGAMGHRSNLDCYFKPRADGSISFEEHASFCGVCVDITLRAKQLLASGASNGSVRAAIDAEFGSIGPGTDTARPAS